MKKAKNYRFTLSIFFLLVTGVPLFCQNYSVDPSLEYIIKGILLHNEEEYIDAIEEYEKVHYNDTNYALALYEKSFSYYKSEKYERAIEASLEGLTLDNFNLKPSFYTNIGNSYSELEKYDKALEYYDIGINEHPYFSSLKYNKAIVLLKQEKYEEGLNLLYENIRQNPFHANSHKMLANLCRDREKNAQALIADIFYLMLGNQSFGDIASLDNYYVGAMESEDEYPTLKLPDDFSDIDELVENKIVITSKYKVPSKLDFPLIKQAHLVINQLDEIEDQGGFWSEFYVPILKNTITEENFEALSLFMVEEGADNVKKIGKLNKKKRASYLPFYFAFVEELENYLSKHKTKNTKGETVELPYFYSDERILGAGELDDNDNMYGYWELMEKGGYVVGKGNFEEGKKTGAWTFYHSNGQVKMNLSYEEGKREGPYKIFNESGILLEQGSFKEGFVDGVIKKYFKYGGGLKSEETYDEGDFEGEYKYYHTNGELSIHGKVEDGKRNGDYFHYANNGQKTYKATYEDGKPVGTIMTWYTSGQKRGEYTYKDGKRDGKYKVYYRDGTVKEEGESKEGVPINKTIEYYRSGNKRMVTELDEDGKVNGTITYYDRSERKENVLEFKKDELIKATSYDSLGKAIHKSQKEGNQIEVKLYDGTGEKRSKGKYLRGNEDDKWVFYNTIELRSSVQRFNEGTPEGVWLEFYNNGQISSEYKYENGNLNGEYKVFYIDGEEYLTGHYREGTKIGAWKYFSEEGKLTSEYYYKDGTKHGWQKMYTTKGEVSYKFLLDDGLLESYVFYDKDGNASDTFQLENGNGEITFTYHDGKTRLKANYKNGESNGKYTWYYPNGKLDTEGIFVGDNKEGNWKSYYKTGQLFQDRNYLNGSLHGKFVSYHKNGKKMSERNYVAGELQGQLIQYYENGKNQYEKNYIDDELFGRYNSYDTEGKLILVRYYRENELVGYTYPDAKGMLKPITKVGKDEQVIEAFYPNGNKSVSFSIKNGLYTDEFIWYYANGKVRKTTKYNSRGNEDGMVKSYYMNGKLKYEYPYKAGELHGIAIDYYENGNKKREMEYYLGDLNGTYKSYNNSGVLTEESVYFDDRHYEKVK